MLEQVSAAATSASFLSMGLLELDATPRFPPPICSLEVLVE